ncbi:MAG: hypothetical protein J6Y78_12965 [Paludibacteraceae bacterium]|nr:hypothetical protein [Paludibacteraceae bacterium]
MKTRKCCNCKSDRIITTQKDIYCAKCGLVLASTTKYVAGQKIDLPWGLIYG